MLKVYYPFNPHISRAMHRIRAALMKHAPPGVAFADDPREADLHILDFIGQHPTIEDRELNPTTGLMRAVPSLPKCRNYVILYHCTAPPGSELLSMDYRPLFENARLVVSYLKPEWTWEWGKLDWSKVEYFHTPWGYEPETFRYGGESKDVLCLMTGYVDVTEGLRAVWWAARQVGGEVVHVGGSIGLDGEPGYKRYENVSDDLMRELYCRSEYVNAIRAHHGFEVVGIEGAACLAQPIYLDLPCYRHWFDDIGIFVDPDDVWDGLKRVFETRPKRENLAEKVKRFEWGKIAPRIWEEILKRL